MLQSKVTTASGVSKTIIANNRSDLSVAISVAKAELPMKTPDINDKKDANKRQKDL